MIRKIGFFAIALMILGIIAMPVYAQGTGTSNIEIHYLAIAMGIAAAGCGIAQSIAVAKGCEGASRNPGATDTIRFFVILGLAFLEFLALLTLVVVLMLQ